MITVDCKSYGINKKFWFVHYCPCHEFLRFLMVGLQASGALAPYKRS